MWQKKMEEEKESLALKNVDAAIQRLEEYTKKKRKERFITDGSTNNNNRNNLRAIKKTAIKYLENKTTVWLLQATN